MVVYNATRVYKSLQSLDMDFFKTIAGRVITGIITTLVFGAGIGLWQMDSSTRSSLMSHTGKIISWLGVVLLTPFLTFFVIAWVHKMRSNAAGGALVFVYTLAEALLLAKLFQWHMASTTGWTFFVVGIMVAGVYNLLTCDWLAEKME